MRVPLALTQQKRNLDSPTFSWKKVVLWIRASWMIRSCPHQQFMPGALKAPRESPEPSLEPLGRLGFSTPARTPTVEPWCDGMRTECSGGRVFASNERSERRETASQNVRGEVDFSHSVWKGAQNASDATVISP